jgi:hypothetical protein
MKDLAGLMVAIAAGDRAAVSTSLDAVPRLATERLARSDERFIAECQVQVYEGDTALHAAAFTYDAELAEDLVARGADLRARNRPGRSHATASSRPKPLLSGRRNTPTPGCESSLGERPRLDPSSARTPANRPRRRRLRRRQARTADHHPAPR